MLAPDKGKKPEEPGALHRLCEPPLVFIARSGMARVNNFRLARDEPAEELDVLVIDAINVLGTKETLLHMKIGFRV